MPKTIAQWTGFAVTVIIVLGRDADVLTAVPLGIAAGMMATLLQAAIRLQRPALVSRETSPAQVGTDTTPAISRGIGLSRPLLALERACVRYRPKRRHAQFPE